MTVSQDKLLRLRSEFARSRRTVLGPIRNHYTIVLHFYGRMVIMDPCKLSSRRRAAWTGCAVLPTPGTVG
jgi:hypothetical protein